MHDVNVLYGIIAFLVLCTAWMGNALLWRREALAPVKAKPINVKATLEAARASRKRVLRPEQIAILVAEERRFEDSESFPLLPAELDDFIDAWCDENDVERVSTDIVRELIALLPFVTRTRIRINLRNPTHRGIRARQEKRGEVNPRPTVYIVANAPADVVDSPELDRAASNVGPTPGPKDRPSVRPKVGQRPVPCPVTAQGAEMGSVAA